MKESKSILVYKTMHGFQKFGTHNKLVGIHLYILYSICHTLQYLEEYFMKMWQHNLKNH